jgi:hypothetical protein
MRPPNTLNGMVQRRAPVPPASDAGMGRVSNGALPCLTNQSRPLLSWASISARIRLTLSRRSTRRDRAAAEVVTPPGRSATRQCRRRSRPEITSTRLIALFFALMQTTRLAPVPEHGQSVPREQGGPYRTVAKERVAARTKELHQSGESGDIASPVSLPRSA